MGMTILTIDTATEILDVSISRKSGEFHERVVHAGLAHTERLMPIVAGILEESGTETGEIELIVCARGPGSFTGLRIGMATAKGLRMATGAHMVSVPTLDIYADPFAWFPGTVIPIIDARRKRVYCALYRNGRRIGEYLDIPIDQIASHTDASDACLIAGNSEPLIESAVGTLVGTRRNAYGTTVPASGKALAGLGETWFREYGNDASDAGPMYLRRSDAEEKLGSG